MNKLLFASVISEIQQSDIFMTVKARICEAPAANLNGARVTEAFIDEIVDNEERYVGLPLYADVRALVNGNFRRLGHLYDARTGEFHSTQIGSFYQFEKETFDGGCYLVGYARIAKRNKKLSRAISELFTDGNLKFSFEVNVGEYEELDDDTILIDASESNYLEGTAIVTFPACEDAVALQLVAQQADDSEGGEKEMADINKLETIEQPITAEEQTAETTPESEAEVIAEEVSEETASENSAEENAACKEKEKGEEDSSETAEKENAAVVIHETTEEIHTTRAYDTESNTDIEQRIAIETEVCHVEPDAQIVEADDGVHIAEADGDPGDSGAPVENGNGGNSNTEPGANVNSGDSGAPAGNGNVGNPNPELDPPAPPEVAADSIPPEDAKKTVAEMIGELSAAVEELRKEIAELKESKVIAETKTLTAEINPIMADIHMESRYSLLEQDEKPSKYSLLSR